MKPKPMKPMKGWAIVRANGRLADGSIICPTTRAALFDECGTPFRGERVQRVLITPVPLPGRKGGQTNGK